METLPYDRGTPQLLFTIEMAEQQQQQQQQQSSDLPEHIVFSIMCQTKVLRHAFLFRSWYSDPSRRTELLVRGVLNSDRMKIAELFGVQVSNAALRVAAENGNLDVCKALMDPSIAGETTFAVARDNNSGRSDSRPRTATWTSARR